MGGSRRFAACGAALAVLVAVIYAPVRNHEYLDYDDMAFLVWNPDVEPASLASAVEIAFTRPLAAGWTPLAMLTHQLDRALWGRSATGPLLENAALHFLGSLLLLLALNRLTGRLAASAFVAAVHAVHPLHVESVAWAIERKDVLSGAFFSGLLWLYARSTEAPQSADRARAVLACFALGLLSKPTLVTAPFVLLLIDSWPLRRLDRGVIREKLPMFAMAALASVLTWQFQRGSGSFAFGAALPIWARAENALDSLVAYLGAAFWPANLCAYYPHPGTSLGPVRVAGCAAVLGAITALSFAMRRRQPWLLTGWLWYVGMMIPVLGLVQVGMQARADRYTYLPLIGISIALAFSADAWAQTPQRRRTAAAVGAACIAALAAAAMAQVDTWRSSRILYTRMHEVHPDAAYPELRLGMVEAIDGDFSAAAGHLDRAGVLEPRIRRDAARQLTDLARSQAAQGRASAAERTLRFVLDYARRTDQPDQAVEIRLLLNAYEAPGPG